MNQIQSVYQKAKTLGTFTADDFLDITTDKHRIGGCFYFLQKRGLIINIDRGRYKITGTNDTPTTTPTNTDKYEILYGLELELEYNREELPAIQLASYHSTNAITYNKDFIAESDGSLHSEYFENGRTAELISIPLNSHDITKAIEGLKNKVSRQFKKKHDRNPELHEVLCFNDTTGAHLHISLHTKNGKTNTIKVRNNKRITINGKTTNPTQLIDIEFLHTITRTIKKRIKRELPEIYDKFIKNYFRNYAKRIKTLQGSRYSEFNTTNDNTLEYRSLHLRGITTWTQLETFYKIVTSTIDEAFNNKLNSDKPFNTENNHNIEIELEDENKTEITETINIEQTNNETINIQTED